MSEQQPQDPGQNSGQKGSNQKLVMKLVGLVVGMFAFGFAMVPLYTLICDITGINKAGGGGPMAEADLVQLGVDYDRTVTVTFDYTLNAGLDWSVKPHVRIMDVHPGKPYDIIYKVKNNSNREVVAQAVPGITPWQATEHFNKTECFCFEQQKLAPGEEADLRLRYVLSRALPEKYNTVTLSYTFMDTNRDNLKRTAAAQ